MAAKAGQRHRQEFKALAALSLDNLQKPARHGGVAQLGEQQLCKLTVAGSKPVTSTMFPWPVSSVGPERSLDKREVVGSSPTPATRIRSIGFCSTRLVSSVGSERSLDKREVGGSRPSLTTRM